MSTFSLLKLFYIVIPDTAWVYYYYSKGVHTLWGVSARGLGPIYLGNLEKDIMKWRLGLDWMLSETRALSSFDILMLQVGQTKAEEEL